LEFSDGSVAYVVHLDDGHSIGKHSYNNTNNKTLIKVTLLNWDRFIGDLKWVQVESGMEATEYEPYVGGKISTKKSLYGIPVKSGGNHIDENGQQWIVDYRDWERGIDVISIAETVLEGTEYFEDFIEDYNTITLAIAHKDQSDIYCTHATQGYGIDWANTSRIKFNAWEFGINKLDEFVELVTSLYNNGNPIRIQYCLNKPIETPIPEDELLAYRATHTNYLHTNILNDSGAYMKLAYATDTKTYIDNKFEELRAAISNNS
jgi:hypothetical protein